MFSVFGSVHHARINCKARVAFKILNGAMDLISTGRKELIVFQLSILCNVRSANGEIEKQMGKKSIKRYNDENSSLAYRTKGDMTTPVEGFKAKMAGINSSPMIAGKSSSMSSLLKD